MVTYGMAMANKCTLNGEIKTPTSSKGNGSYWIFPIKKGDIVVSTPYITNNDGSFWAGSSSVTII